MSYDFSMVAPVGPDDETVALETYWRNYTFNVAPMFRLAFEPFEHGDTRGVWVLNGRAGWVAGSVLDEAIKRMEADPAAYRALNPENGWGDYEGALGVLCELRLWCIEVPSALVEVSA